MSAELVFCLPHAGGGAHQYLSWTSAFTGAFEWVPVEYPGHFTRDNERCYATFASAVDGLTDEIEACAAGRRIGIFGHSLGGSLAFEVGRRLVARRRTALDTLVISSAEPPSALNATRQRYFELDDEELMAHLQDLDGARAGSPLRRRLLAETLPLIRADYRLHHSYCPDNQASISVPLHICSGRGEPMTSGRILGWRRHTSGSAEFHRFDGGHFYWLPAAAHLTDVLREVFAARPGGVPGTEMRGPSCRR